MVIFIVICYFVCVVLLLWSVDCYELACVGC